MKNLIFIVAVLFSANITAQDMKKEAPVQQTKIDAFVSKTGIVNKFQDFNLDNLKCSYEVASTRVRRLSAGPDAKYFYQIEKSGDYGAVASIEYSDLLEVIKALRTLKAEADGDLASNPDYLENKFVTVDGFEVGYFISKNKLSWYIKLEKYGTHSTLFLRAREDVETAFMVGEKKFEDIRKGI